MLKVSARDLVSHEFKKESLVALDSEGSTYKPELWDKIASVGWLGILIPEQYGGEGRNLTDTAILFEELGRGPVPGPHFSSAVLGALIILEGGTEEQKLRILPEIASGRVVLALANTEEEYGWGHQSIKLTAHKRSDVYTLTGTKVFVRDVDGATHLICTAKVDDGRVCLFLLDSTSPGISIRPLFGFTTGVFEVRLEEVEVPYSSIVGVGSEDGWAILEGAMEKAIPILCAYKLGGCDKVFEMSLDYSNSRVQFGGPIGRFQRVQDHIIEMVNQRDAIRWTTYEALWKLDTGKKASSNVHMSKAIASEGYYVVCNEAHEVHAGVGVMREYGLTLHTKMSRALYHYLGNPTYHKQRLAAALEL